MLSMQSIVEKKLKLTLETFEQANLVFQITRIFDPTTTVLPSI